MGMAVRRAASSSRRSGGVMGWAGRWDSGPPAAAITPPGQTKAVARAVTATARSRSAASSVEDAAACGRVADIVRRHGGPRPVVVVSALAGVTDALLRCAWEGALRAFDPHLERHREIARRLLGPEASAAFLGELERARGELGALVERIGREPALRAPLQDEIVSYGERLSAPLLAAALAAAGLPARHVDARRCIVTDETPGRATPDSDATAARTRAVLVPLLDGGTIPVLGGYIGASAGGGPTTPGGGGPATTPARSARGWGGRGTRTGPPGAGGRPPTP